MAKLHDSRTEPWNETAGAVLWFHCVGCKRDHGFTLPGWDWNGSMEKPTFTPSLMCDRGDPTHQCHTIITDGKIAYQSDCHHALAGQTIEMVNWEGWNKWD